MYIRAHARTHTRTHAHTHAHTHTHTHTHTIKQVAKGMSTTGFDWMLFFRALGVEDKLLTSDAKVVRVLDVKYYQV